MNLLKKTILYILFAIVAVYFAFLYSFGHRVEKVINDIYATRKLSIPTKIFEVDIWKALSNYFNKKLYDTKPASDSIHENLKWYVKNLENYNIYFTKASCSFSFFGIEYSLENFTEENSDGILEYSAPVKIGLNLFTQKIYLAYKGKILVKNHPISEEPEFIIDVNAYNKADVNFKAIIAERDKLNIWFLLSQINRVEQSIAELSLFNSNKELLISVDHGKREWLLVHDSHYSNIDDLILNAPKDISLNSEGKFSNINQENNFKVFSILALLDNNKSKQQEKLSWRYKNNAKDWSDDVIKTLMNSEFYLTSKSDYPDLDFNSTKLELIITAPDKNNFGYSLLFDVEGKQSKNNFLKDLESVFFDKKYNALVKFQELIKNSQNQIPDYINQKFFLQSSSTVQLDGSKTNIKINLPKAQILINDRGIELYGSNSELSNPKGLDSIGLEGKFNILGASEIIEFVSSGTKSYLNLSAEETEILSTSFYKTLQTVVGVENTNFSQQHPENVATNFNINLSTFKLGNYSLEGIYTIFYQNIDKEAAIKLTPEQKLIFLDKLK
ncbi:MAG: hypothetical protein K9G11_00515 [Rickettsiaceae bacterium]|nr:hypothetical protein [Rickettsiaceae bacterium]